MCCLCRKWCTWVLCWQWRRENHRTRSSACWTRPLSCTLVLSGSVFSCHSLLVLVLNNSDSVFVTEPFCRVMAERSKRQKYKIWLEAIFRIYMPQCITRAYWMFSLLPYFLMPDVAKRSKSQSIVDLLCQIEVSAITLADRSKSIIGRVSYVTSTMAIRSKAMHQLRTTL